MLDGLEVGECTRDLIQEQIYELQQTPTIEQKESHATSKKDSGANETGDTKKSSLDVESCPPFPRS